MNTPIPRLTLARRTGATLLAIATLAASSLACSTINQGLVPQLTPVPPAYDPGQDPANTTPGPNSGLGEDNVGPFEIEGGPTVASPRDARVAIEAGEVTALTDLAPETNDYTNEDVNTVPGILRYTIKLDGEQKALLHYGWCAKGEDVLAQNLADMAIEFRIGDTVIPPEQLLVGLSQQPDVTSGDTLVCQSFYAVIYDWPEGDTVLEVDVDFTTSVFDGLDDYGPGLQQMIYTVTR